MKSLKKILGMAIALMLTMSLVSVGVWAYFSDSERSQSNILSAGTLDLKTNGADGVSGTFTMYVLPNNTTGVKTITLSNVGSLDASSLTVRATYTPADASSNTVNMSDDQVARVIEITSMTFGGISYLGSLPDRAPLNAYPDIYDMNEPGGFTIPSGIVHGNTKDFVFTLQVGSGISNDYMGDGINITLTFTLNQ